MQVVPPKVSVAVTLIDKGSHDVPQLFGSEQPASFRHDGADQVIRLFDIVGATPGTTPFHAHVKEGDAADGTPAKVALNDWVVDAVASRALLGPAGKFASIVASVVIVGGYRCP